MKKLICLLAFLVTCPLFAQEGLRELSCNLNYLYGDLNPDAAQQPAKPVTQKKVPSVTLPFKEDFYYATKQKYPRQDLWMDSTVYVNSGFARAPPSIGVATFDGLNKHGFPYKLLPLDLSSSSYADTLTSQPINLFTVAGQTLMPTNNVGLSFYYQARGFGEPPEAGDSLMLDLYKPRQNAWINRVWAMRGNLNPNTNDTAFRRVFIKILDTAYFHDGFKFRFRNKATILGNFDHWHIDYIYLNQNRDSIADTLYNDITFSQVPTPFLKDYSAMPFRQFNSSEMAKKNSVLMQNNFNSDININYKHEFYDENNTKLYTYSAFSDNIKPFKYYGYFNNPVYSNPASQSTFTFSFPSPLPKAQGFKTEHYIYRTATVTDFNPNNDTVVQQHLFYDYYAFDDGSPEAGYYVNGAKGKMVVRIRVNTTDTLRALRVYFDPAPIGSAWKYYFKILVRSGATLPGAELSNQDALYYPRYSDTLFKPIPEYNLPEPLILSPGTYYIGIQQEVSTGLVVGFDRNYDAHTNLFYDAGAGFFESSIKGAIMIRPVFGSRVGDLTGVTQVQPEKESFEVYPNPASDRVTVQTTDVAGQKKITLYNSFGQLLLERVIEENVTTINTEGYPAGIYFLNLTGGGKSTLTRKIVITD